MHTRIRKWGNSQAIRLPKVIMDSAGLKESDEVQLLVKEGIIYILPARRHKTLRERAAEYHGQ